MILFTAAAVIYGVCHFAFHTTFPELDLREVRADEIHHEFTDPKQ